MNKQEKLRAQWEALGLGPWIEDVDQRTEFFLCWFRTYRAFLRLHSPSRDEIIDVLAGIVEMDEAFLDRALQEAQGAVAAGELEHEDAVGRITGLLLKAAEAKWKRDDEDP